MRRVSGRIWKQLAIVAVLVGVDLAVSLPIMGATYRPFSWMEIAPADAATLYPVIQNLSFEGGMPRMSVDVSPGTRVVLQRSTNLLDAIAWTDVAEVTATERVTYLIDTNPISRAVFYRTRHILAETP